MDIKENTTWIKNLNVIFMAEDSPLNIYDNSTSRNQRTTALFASSLYSDLNINDAVIFASQSFKLTEALLKLSTCSYGCSSI